MELQSTSLCVSLTPPTAPALTLYTVMIDKVRINFSITGFVSYLQKLLLEGMKQETLSALDGNRQQQTACVCLSWFHLLFLRM